MKELFLGLALCMQVVSSSRDIGASSYKIHSHHPNFGQCSECEKCLHSNRMITCVICHPEKKNTFRKVETQTQDFMCLGWIYGDNSIFVGWIKNPTIIKSEPRSINEKYIAPKYIGKMLL